MKNFDSKQEGTFVTIAAILVLFSAMLNPIISVILSLIVLSGFGIYKFKQN